MSDGTIAVLVAERDGEWEAWAQHLRSTASDVRVIAQRPSEPASAFAARVRAEMRGLEEGGGPIVSDAVLVGGLACDPEVLGARVLVVHALTSQMPVASRLHLDGAGRSRLAMEALAQIVSEQLEAAGVWVLTERAPQAATGTVQVPLAA